MNFIKYEQDFKQILFKGKAKTKAGKDKDTFHRGMYIFSRDLDDVRFKVGLSYGESGLYTRLKNQYRICYAYPNEFFVHFLVLSLAPRQARQLEKKMLADLKTIPKETNSTSNANNEWKIVSNREELKQKLRAMLNANKDLWFAVVVFNKKNMRVIDNTRDLSELDLNKPSNTRINHKVRALR